MSRRSATVYGSPVLPWNKVVSRSKASARLWAGSTLMTSVRYPSRESCRPVAAARLVFPTPPLPLKRRMRITYFTAAPRPALQFREEADDNPDMFEWKDEYSVHIHSIDAQHQNLFRMAGELHSAMLAGQAKSVMGKVLDRLVQYTAMHFAHEERLMRQRNYPGFESHKVEHDALTRK